jgi:DNA modification methylase
MLHVGQDGLGKIEQYRNFLRAKAVVTPDRGFSVEVAEINPMLKPHQKVLVKWAIAGGRRAIFAKFGLGKTFMQLETVRLALSRAVASGSQSLLDEFGRGLITCPLGVRGEFLRDAAKLGIELKFIRSIEEADAPGLYLTNFETVRDGKLDPGCFTVCSLDEASVLRGFGGTKTFREFMRLYEGVAYKFVATAIPDPNDHIELLAYAAFLGIMDVGQAKTRFFKRDATKADTLTLHPHKEREFWLWVSSWAIFLQKPSDLGFSDEGYDLPPMEVRYHEIPVDHSNAPVETNGQGTIFRGSVQGVVEASREKRDTLGLRVAKMQEIMAASPADHFLLWHDLEAERRAIESAVPGVVSVYGTQDLDEREQAILDFSEGRIQHLAAKPVIAGSGCNFQRHCHRAIFVGIGFKFNDFIQAIHRILRYLQQFGVVIEIIFAESEREVLRSLQTKWAQYEETVQKMSEIIREYGLDHAAKMQELIRSMGVERVEVAGDNYRLINNDCVEEAMQMAENSVDMVLTSIPFSTQYEYTPSYNDFGHTDDNEHFFEQMDFLTPELLRALRPGRIAAIHVKDRIVPGGMTGLGFQTVYPFHCRCIEHFTRHGFAYMGMKTIVTDVVRENNQTNRLGYSEMCKDGTRMGVGMPEYLLLFRKPQTDTSKGYGDKRVARERFAGYSLARWQLQASGFDRSSGERLLMPEELQHLDHQAIYKIWKKYNLEHAYSFEYHVKIGERLAERKMLPTDFTLIPAHSWHPDVWSDVTRMLTLNGAQHAKGREMHLCPMQFDIADRAIEQFTMEGETVHDPFGGLMTTAYRALKLKRKAICTELNPRYFLDGCAYAKAMEEKMSMPTLFDTLEELEEIA